MRLVMSMTIVVITAVDIVKSTAYKYLVEMNDRGMLKYDGRELITDKIQKVNTETTHVAVLGSISCEIPQLEKYVTLPMSVLGCIRRIRQWSPWLRCVGTDYYRDSSTVLLS